MFFDVGRRKKKCKVRNEGCRSRRYKSNNKNCSLSPDPPAVVDKSFVDLSDLASVSAENTNALSTAPFVGIAFDGPQFPSFHTLHNASVTAAAWVTGVDDEDHAGMDQLGIIFGLGVGDAADAFSSGFVSMVQDPSGFDAWIPGFELQGRLFETPVDKGGTPGIPPFKACAAQILFHPLSSVGTGRVLQNTDFSAGDVQYFGQQRRLRWAGLDSGQGALAEQCFPGQGADQAIDDQL